MPESTRLSFRQKIFVSYLFVFLTVIAVIFPGTHYLVNRQIYKAMEARADEFIAKIQGAPGDDALVRRLKAEKHVTFFRISIISHSRNILYDSHTKRLLGPRFTQEFIVDHPEVLEAFDKGIGFASDYSDLLSRKFVYLAKAFDFHSEKYVIRVAFPYNYIEKTGENVRAAIIFFVSGILFLVSIMTWFVINRMTRPLQKIINTVRLYGEESEILPHIDLEVNNSQDDVCRLADTLNSLSNRVQRHINTLTAERNEQEAVLEALVEGVIAVDASQKVIYLNSMAAKMFSLNKEEVMGQPVSALNQDKAASQLSKSQIENTTFTDTLMLKGIGQRVYLNMVSAPKGRDGGAILVLQDQSQYHHILNMRRNFIANASHELKTPITIIKGFAETLHDNPQLPLATIEEITKKISRNCNRMTILVKDLLALADIEALPASRLIEVDLLDLLDQCKMALLDLFPDAQLTITPTDIDRSYTLVGDPSLLEMAFYNLMTNGAKYSDPPAKLQVILKHHDKKIEIQFSDKGIGIPEDHLENIFQRFYTVDSKRSRAVGGSGLGLSIVETIVEKHNGEIGVTSKIGEGTTFTLTLPLRELPIEGL